MKHYNFCSQLDLLREGERDESREEMLQSDVILFCANGIDSLPFTATQKQNRIPSSASAHSVYRTHTHTQAGRCCCRLHCCCCCKHKAMRCTFRVTKAKIVPDLDVYNLFKCIDVYCQSQRTMQSQNCANYSHSNPTHSTHTDTHAIAHASKSASAKRCMRKLSGANFSN